MHRAGAAALTELLQFPAPAADHHTVACACGYHAHYLELRAKPLLTAVGRVEVSRPYYLCAHCHKGQFPAAHTSTSVAIGSWHVEPIECRIGH